MTMFDLLDGTVDIEGSSWVPEDDAGPGAEDSSNIISYCGRSLRKRK